MTTSRAMGGQGGPTLPSPLLGRGVLAIWNSVAPEDDVLFNSWYTREHVPERLAIPGWVRARRYAEAGRAASEPQHYMTLHETEDLSVLASAPYLDRLNHPSDLTVRVAPTLVDLVRAACAVTLSFGRGIGGAVGSLTFGLDEESLSTELVRWLAGPGVERLLGHPDVIGFHYCVADPVTAALKDNTREGAARSGAASVHSLLAVEATCRRGVDAAEVALRGAISGHRIGLAPELRLRRFELLVSMERANR